MTKIRPFRAVRPSRDKVSWVSCKALDSYGSEKVASKLDFNPFTFLHVVSPAYRYSKENLDQEDRFELVKQRYQKFKDDKILFQDVVPSFYIYKKVTPKDRVYCGVVAAVSVDDVKSNVVKKHEATLKKKEEMFEYYFKNTGFNAEPVLLSYPVNEKIESIKKSYTCQRAEYEFSTQDKNLHLLWLIQDKKDIEILKDEFAKVDSLIIADGHHRTMAALMLADFKRSQNPSYNGNEPYNYFMGYLLPESDLCISAFNRFVTDLNGLTEKEFLIELDKIFKITNYREQRYVSDKLHYFSMYLGGNFYSLELREKHLSSDEFRNLDSEILYKTVLKGVLGIGDVRSDKRMYYAANVDDPLALKSMVDDKFYSVAFGMYPVSIQTIKQVTELGETLLPKTTYVEPKIRSAMTIYEW